MKYLNSILILVAFGLFVNQAFGAFNIEELQAVTKLALEDFKKTQVEHTPHFFGYKSWKSGEDAKVKIYVNHDGMKMEFDYVCHKHADKMECHGQH